jgi:hypothetical protein
MKAAFGGMSGAVALLLAGAPALAPALAQEPPATPAPAHAPHHSAHHRHHARHAQISPDEAAAIPSQPQPQADAHPGTEPAPVPNEDIGPPSHTVPSGGEYTAQGMGIHYPPIGNGYLPGSSSSDMDNRTTPAVPGVQYQTPLANPAPQPLPPPDSGNVPKP